MANNDFTGTLSSPSVSGVGGGSSSSSGGIRIEQESSIFSDLAPLAGQALELGLGIFEEGQNSALDQEVQKFSEDMFLNDDIENTTRSLSNAKVAAGQRGKQNTFGLRMLSEQKRLKEMYPHLAHKIDMKFQKTFGVTGQTLALQERQAAIKSEAAAIQARKDATMAYAKENDLQVFSGGLLDEQATMAYVESVSNAQRTIAANNIADGVQYLKSFNDIGTASSNIFQQAKEQHGINPMAWPKEVQQQVRLTIGRHIEAIRSTAQRGIDGIALTDVNSRDDKMGEALQKSMDFHIKHLSNLQASLSGASTPELGTMTYQEMIKVNQEHLRYALMSNPDLKPVAVGMALFGEEWMQSTQGKALMNKVTKDMQTDPAGMSKAYSAIFDTIRTTTVPDFGAISKGTYASTGFTMLRGGLQTRSDIEGGIDVPIKGGAAASMALNPDITRDSEPTANQVKNLEALTKEYVHPNYIEKFRKYTGENKERIGLETTKTLGRRLVNLMTDVSKHNGFREQFAVERSSVDGTLSLVARRREQVDLPNDVIRHIKEANQIIKTYGEISKEIGLKPKQSLSVATNQVMGELSKEEKFSAGMLHSRLYDAVVTPFERLTQATPSVEVDISDLDLTQERRRAGTLELETEEGIKSDDKTDVQRGSLPIPKVVSDDLRAYNRGHLVNTTKPKLLSILSDNRPEAESLKELIIDGLSKEAALRLIDDVDDVVIQRKMNEKYPDLYGE